MRAKPLQWTVLGCLLLGIPFVAPAATIAYDGFNYPTGNLDAQDGGIGWNGAWFLSSLETYHNTVGSPGFSIRVPPAASTRRA